MGWGGGSPVDHCSKESKEAIALVKTARGQVDAVLRMMEGDRYCVDVSKQILATMALLKKANLIILRQHIDTCVKDAIRKDEGEEKIDEIASILEAYIGNL
jgi:DNA-binding FrmR family transcriptional regulator